MSTRMIVFSRADVAQKAADAIFRAVKRRFPTDPATSWGAVVQLKTGEYAIASPAGSGFSSAGLDGPALDLEKAIAGERGGRVCDVTPTQLADS